MEQGKKPTRKKQSNAMKNAGFFMIVGILILMIVMVLVSPSDDNSMPFSDVQSQARADNIEKIVQTGSNLEITLKNGDNEDDDKIRTSYKDSETSLSDPEVIPQNFTLEVNQPSNSGQLWLNIALAILPIVLIIGFFYFMTRQVQGQGNQALNFGKSKAKLFGADKEKITFKEVAGNEEAKEDLEEVVEFLKYPRKFRDVGAKISKGNAASWSSGNR